MRLVGATSLFLVLLLATATVRASDGESQEHESSVTIEEILRHRFGEITSALEYSPTPSASFAEVSSSQAIWLPLRSMMVTKSRELLIIDPSWQGSGWFRFQFTVKRSTPALYVSMFVYNGCDIYLDGQLIRSLGSTQGDRGSIPRDQIVLLDPAMDRSDTARVHTLLFHVRTETFRYLMNDGSAVGLNVWMGRIDEMHPARMFHVSRGLRTRLIPFGMILALGVLHLLIFLFDRRSTVNLLYVAFTTTLAGILVSLEVQVSTTSAWLMDVSNAINVNLWALIIAVALLLISNLYYGTISLRRWIVVASSMILVVTLPNFYDGVGTTLWGVFVCLATVDFMRLTVTSMYRRVEDAWIIGVGLLIFSIYLLTWFFSVYLNLITVSESVWYVIFVSGLISMPFCMSVFLARRITKTNRSLTKQLERVQVLTAEKLAQERRVVEEELQRMQLEADNQRKTTELEEARKLQLSMLPSSMPSTDHVKTSMVMHTATEVGGDYVDYYIHGPETLTFAIGDATGHGLKAGVMVATTKSHFQTHALSASHPEILQHTGDGIRKLSLRGLYMCLGLLTIDGRRCTWTSAGIPPLLHYQIRTATVCEHLVKGLPLGAPRNGDLSSLEFAVESGDVLLAMTDGLPELFNAKNVSLGYGPIAETLAAHSGKDVEQIIDQLVHIAEQWSAGEAFNDDVTMLVIKIQ